MESVLKVEVEIKKKLCDEINLSLYVMIRCDVCNWIMNVINLMYRLGKLYNECKWM